MVSSGVSPSSRILLRCNWRCLGYSQSRRKSSSKSGVSSLSFDYFSTWALGWNRDTTGACALASTSSWRRGVADNPSHAPPTYTEATVANEVGRLTTATGKKKPKVRENLWQRAMIYLLYLSFTDETILSCTGPELWRSRDYTSFCAIKGSTRERAWSRATADKLVKCRSTTAMYA